MQTHTPLQKAIKIAGGQTALARAIGTNQSTLWTWLNRADGNAAPEYCRRIEAATGVSRYELRQDVFGPRPEEAANAAQ